MVKLLMQPFDSIPQSQLVNGRGGKKQFKIMKVWKKYPFILDLHPLVKQFINHMYHDLAKTYVMDFCSRSHIHQDIAVAVF